MRNEEKINESIEKQLDVQREINTREKDLQVLTIGGMVYEKAKFFTEGRESVQM